MIKDKRLLDEVWDFETPFDVRFKKMTSKERCAEAASIAYFCNDERARLREFRGGR